MRAIRLLESMGCVPSRNGDKHDWYDNPAR